MAIANGMICLRCGVEMNHHGDKVVYAAAPEGPERIDWAEAGTVFQFHTCPKCGGAGCCLA